MWMYDRGGVNVQLVQHVRSLDESKFLGILNSESTVDILTRLKFMYADWSDHNTFFISVIFYDT